MRKALELRGVRQESLQITLASLDDSSYKQYETCFKKWWTFCAEREISPFESSVKNTLIFLTELYNAGAAHSSINCFRSAISLLVGSDIAQDDNIKRFFKGISKLRSSKPKYDSTWDPKIVLDCLTLLSNNEKLSIKDLTRKIICLIALVTGHRIKTFSLIRVENIELKDKPIEIKIPDRIKTSGSNRKQPVLVLPYYNKNKKICAASTLMHYIERTQSIRGKVETLFISFKRSHGAVSAQTLSRWVKLTLKESGIDTDVFTAHSTRYA